MLLRTLSAATLALLAACANPLPGGPAVAASCAAQPAGVIGLVESRGRPLVPVRIGNSMVNLAIDTGASRTSLTEAAVQRLGLRRDQGRQNWIHGTGGVLVSSGVVVEMLEFNGRRIARPTVAVHPLPGSEGAQPSIDGLLGADLLADYDIDLDIAARRLVLHAIRAGCPSAEPAWTDRPALPLPVERRGRMFMLDAQVTGQPVRALFDTGALSTGITELAARRLNVTEAMLDAAPRSEGRGADGNARLVRRIRFEEVRIGPDAFRPVTLGVSRMMLPPGAEMLLGLDYMRPRRFFLSYSSGRAWVGARSAGPAAAPGAAGAGPGLGEPVDRLR